MKRLFTLILSCALLAISLCGCNGENTQNTSAVNSSAGSYVYMIHNVQELADESFLDTEFIGELATPGTYSVHVGENTYCALTEYKVCEVLKGDPSLEGQTVLVSEVYAFVGASTIPSPSCAELGSSKAILCAHTLTEEGYLIIHEGNQIIPIGEDGSVSFDSSWPDAGDYKTLDDFRALFDESDRVASAENTVASTEPTPTALSSAELETFEKWLNEPENNGFLLSSYDFISDADLDAVLAAAQDLSYGEADETQKSIYEAVTGTDASTLRVLKDSDLALYLQMKTGCDSSVFSNFSWLYMASYDAWFAPETSPAFTPVHCTGGTVLDDEYCITYEPTGEVSADLTSGTITLYPFEDGWRVLANQYADASGSLN